MTDEPQWLRKALRAMLRLREDAMDEAIVAAVDDLRRDPSGAIVGGGHDALRASLRAVLGAGDIADAELIAIVRVLRRVESASALAAEDLRHLRAALLEILGVSAGMVDADLIALIRRDHRDPATRAADDQTVDDRAALRSELTRLRARDLDDAAAILHEIGALVDATDAPPGLLAGRVEWLIARAGSLREDATAASVVREYARRAGLPAGLDLSEQMAILIDRGARCG